jgi:circadian clock protein KaiC
MSSQQEKSREEPRSDSEQPQGGMPEVDPSGQDCAETGIQGLDQLLIGGFPREHTYLIEGEPGSGKTTLGLQFCISGAKRGERVLYLSTCESEKELQGIARAHGWSLDGVHIYHHDTQTNIREGLHQSVFHPAEVELPRTMEAIFSVIDQTSPQRLVVDSLSELRHLAVDPKWFRRELLALKEDLDERHCTTLLCDESLEVGHPVASIVHGVVQLEQLATDYGPDRRRIRVTKLRGIPHVSGFHDMRIQHGGISVYPRLVAAEHRQKSDEVFVASGITQLDQLCGGGIEAGATTLLLGAAGAGKSITATQLAVAAAERGERAALFVFDERIQTTIRRARGLGVDLERHVDCGLIDLIQVDPAELTPGEFSWQVRRAVEKKGVKLVVIDSLVGYAHAMPNDRLLALHLHELLAFLSQLCVTTIVIMTQHGLPGTQRQAPFDVSYVADTVILFHLFEFAGEMRKAISVFKRRGGRHEASLRELSLGPEGISIGEPLRQFHGVLSGVPDYTGKSLPDVSS